MLHDHLRALGWRVKLTLHRREGSLTRRVGRLAWLHLVAVGPLIDLEVGCLSVRAARVAVVGVDVVVLDDALDVDVVDVAVLAVRRLGAFRLKLGLVCDYLSRVRRHALRVHLLLIE